MNRPVRRRTLGEASTFLTLTSLVDLFTNIVLFLLYNFSDGATAIPSADRLRLPESLALAEPRQTVTIMITQTDIVLDGRRIISTAGLAQSEDLLIPELKSALDYEAERGRHFAGLTVDGTFEGRVTILGDQNIPFRLLERVMFTCSMSDFGQIDLAVLRKETA